MASQSQIALLIVQQGEAINKEYKPFINLINTSKKRISIFPMCVVLAY